MVKIFHWNKNKSPQNLNVVLTRLRFPKRYMEDVSALVSNGVIVAGGGFTMETMLATQKM